MSDRLDETISTAIAKSMCAIPLTQDETGIVAGISRIRVQELEYRAKRKIREQLANDPELRDLIADMFGDID